MVLAIIGAVVAGLGLLGATLATFVKIVRHLTNIETQVRHMGSVVAHVPNHNYRITTIERHLGISTPELPVFVNGHAAEE